MAFDEEWSMSWLFCNLNINYYSSNSMEHLFRFQKLLNIECVLTLYLLMHVCAFMDVVLLVILAVCIQYIILTKQRW